MSGYSHLAIGGTIHIPHAPLRKLPFVPNQIKGIFPSLASVLPALTIKDGTKHFKEVTYASSDYCAKERDKTGTK